MAILVLLFRAYLMKDILDDYFHVLHKLNNNSFDVYR